MEKEEFKIIEPIKYKYKCYLFGGSTNDRVWQCNNPPNFFWRFMQYVCFGNKWVKN